MALGPAIPIGFWLLYDWALEHQDMAPEDILERLEGARRPRRGPPRRNRGSRRSRVPLPKPKRKVSPYQREFGRQLKKLKKKHPRTPVTKLMKRAHAATKRARRGK